MRLLVLPGDGIGPEIMAATLEVLDSVSARFALGLKFVHDMVGHASLARHGTTVREELIDEAKRCAGIVLGPTATFEFKDPSKGEVNPSMFFRKRLDLYANIRPNRTFPNLPNKLGPFDLVIARENTEGFYADRNMEAGGGEILVTPDVAISLRRITRQCSERIADAAFRLAMARRKRVTIVHKANVLKVTDGLFIESCRRVAANYPEVIVDDELIDAMVAHIVRRPSRFDVIVTSNMYGDILSDLTAELAGSLGLGASINSGTDYGMAQASHGSAPDIAGKDIANPFSLVLSAGLLLGWLGQRHGSRRLLDAARAIETGVEAAIATGETTRDLGGALGTGAVGHSLARRIAEAVPA
ncbi:MAG: 3-isopropylmalate dehydrogenase [Devosia sp.]|uniref:isocitrate/isopropylmalate dehydrogenase family protein n=1 Tax=Devosia sp. TaxID=1871048 RepID=UPI002619B80D|nr:isocitrate/isopropylmalate dehydrogenase family protein [Devosia sp.]MDB5541716.1 3-isopropylmalate dehydrogenase [Devosia sp.]